MRFDAIDVRTLAGRRTQEAIRLEGGCALDAVGGGDSFQDRVQGEARVGVLGGHVRVFVVEVDAVRLRFYFRERTMYRPTLRALIC